MTHFSESTAAFNNTSLMQSLPTLIKENLSKREEWDYDIFELERLSSHRLVVKFQITVNLSFMNHISISIIWALQCVDHEV